RFAVFQVDVLFFCEMLELIDNVVDESNKVVGRHGQLEAPILLFPEIEQLVHQIEQPKGVIFYRHHHRLRTRIEIHIGQQVLHGCQNKGEGRTELMGYAGEKIELDFVDFPLPFILQVLQGQLVLQAASDFGKPDDDVEAGCSQQRVDEVRPPGSP